MVEMKDFSALWSDVQPVLLELAREARELRDAPRPGIADTVSDMRNRAVGIRGRIDRLEQIVADTGRLSARAGVYVSECQDAYDDAFAGSARAYRPPEYSTAKEREAVHMAAAFTELVALRTAKRRLADAAEVYEYARLLHRGLDGARRDETVFFNMLTFENRLDS